MLEECCCRPLSGCRQTAGDRQEQAQHRRSSSRRRGGSASRPLHSANATQPVSTAWAAQGGLQRGCCLPARQMMPKYLPASFAIRNRFHGDAKTLCAQREGSKPLASFGLWLATNSKRFFLGLPRANGCGTFYFHSPRPSPTPLYYLPLKLLHFLHKEKETLSNPSGEPFMQLSH